MKWVNKLSGLSILVISQDVSTVTVRAHDLVHGYGGKEMVVKVPPY